ncbi:MAG: hypothetical protein Q9M50_14285 [Methylococcales bacterium]|nr:hypothetical protein [Methylococcales bacterium]
MCGQQINRNIISKLSFLSFIENANVEGIEAREWLENALLNKHEPPYPFTHVFCQSTENDFKIKFEQDHGMAGKYCPFCKRGKLG